MFAHVLAHGFIYVCFPLECDALELGAHNQLSEAWSDWTATFLCPSWGEGGENVS